jgi:hypothetical protein
MILINDLIADRVNLMEPYSEAHEIGMVKYGNILVRANFGDASRRY